MDEPLNTSDAAPPPRAFAQGTGILLQTIGIMLALSSSCLWSLAGKWDKTLDRGQVYQQMHQGQTIGVSITHLFDDPGRAGFMLTVVFTTIGGLAIAAFGLGLQSDKPRSAWGATISAGLLTIVLMGAGVGLWMGTTSIIMRLWNALLVGVVLILFGFAVAALKQVLADPPPRGLHPVPPGFDVRDVLAGEKPSKLAVKELRARIEAEQRELQRLERELENPNNKP